MAAAPYRTAPPRRLSAPVLAVRNTVLFPGQTLELAVGRERSLAAVAAAAESAAELLVVSQTSEETDEPDPARGDLAGVGTVGRVVQIIRLDEHSVVTVQGASRVRVVAWRQRDPFLLAEAELMESGEHDGRRAEAMRRRFAGYAAARGLPADPLPDDIAGAADAVAGRLWIARDERQRLLEAADTGARIELIDGILARDAARPPDARVLVPPARLDLAWSGDPGPTARGIGVAIDALERVAAVVQPRTAFAFSIPREGSDDPIRQYVKRGHLDTAALRDILTHALGRRPQSAVGWLLFPRIEPVFVPFFRIVRARVRVEAPLASDGRFELETPDGRVAIPVEAAGGGVWAEAPDDPSGEHRWEPVRIEVRVVGHRSNVVSMRLWSQWSRWGSGAPLLLDEVRAMLGRRWRVVDED